MTLATVKKGYNDQHAQTQQELQRLAGILTDNRGGRVAGKPDVMIIIESGGQDRNCLGSFMANSWANVDLESRKLETKREQYTVKDRETGEESKKFRNVGTIHEISIKAEHLTGTIYEICGTLAHELVHLENHDHDVQDCSKGGAHNGKFKETAEEWGLTFDIPAYAKDENGQPLRHKSKGWAYTGEGEEFKKLVDEVLKPRVELFNIAKVPTSKAPSKSSSVTLQCECPGGNDAPKSITMSIGAMTTRIEQDTEIVCPACDAKFQVRD